MHTRTNFHGQVKRDKEVCKLIYMVDIFAVQNVQPSSPLIIRALMINEVGTRLKAKEKDLSGKARDRETKFIKSEKVFDDRSQVQARTEA